MAHGVYLLARFYARATEPRGPLIGKASTFNEAHIVLLRDVLPRFGSDVAPDKCACDDRGGSGAPMRRISRHSLAPTESALSCSTRTRGLAAINAGGEFPVCVTV